MEWKDVIPVIAGAVVILVVALVVKPALLGEPIGFGSRGTVPVGDRPYTSRPRRYRADAVPGGR
ncbi:hypothetical protein [Methanoculleus chikugoensis]|uniref:hypothetical protein n=1 Tax=Methanoculleus chikugoensis TaxID=118126 RepID=UPI001FB4715E|nr:hypothetical protein [Methanoculleus chikugoensis]